MMMLMKMAMLIYDFTIYSGMGRNNRCRPHLPSPNLTCQGVKVNHQHQHSISCQSIILMLLLITITKMINNNLINIISLAVRTREQHQ